MGAERSSDTLPPRLWRGRVAKIWLRPWYDRLATWAVARLQLPLSRAWAAEESAGTPLAERRAAAEAAWRDAAFAAEPPAPDRLAALEDARRRLAARWMARRYRHPAAVFLRPPADFALAGPKETEAAHVARLAEPEIAYPPAGAALGAAVEAGVEVSHGFGRRGRTVRWLRFPAADGGTAWARLESPPGPVRGTLIALHGICMETEFWPPAPDYTGAALACGWQVLRPEAPWHGRRRRPGTYGGEPLIAGGPKAFLDFFALAIPELAVWTAWARRERPGMPVAWSGVSLGALTAQKAADAARAWPAGLRPDGLLLVATAGQLAQAILDGRLGRLLGLRPRLRAAGWTEDDFARWAPLLDPAAPCPLPAERVRLLLGSADDLLPFAQGVALARRWDLPAGQVTVRRQGHFSVSLGLLAEPAPLVELLDRLG